MRDMTSIYFKMPTETLRVLRSKKAVERERLRSNAPTYLNLQAIRALNQQIKWIDAVLASRVDQLELL